MGKRPDWLWTTLISPGKHGQTQAMQGPEEEGQPTKLVGPTLTEGRDVTNLYIQGIEKVLPPKRGGNKFRMLCKKRGLLDIEFIGSRRALILNGTFLWVIRSFVGISLFVYFDFNFDIFFSIVFLPYFFLLFFPFICTLSVFLNFLLTIDFRLRG